MHSPPAPLAAAYAWCEQIARSHYENFPVASRLLPAPMRPHVAALYAFARAADDIADEGTAPPGERQARIQVWQERLHRAAREPTIDRPTGDGDVLILAAVGHSIRSLDLPIALFDDLVSAFRQDITTTRYNSWREVLDYCRRSANPVGRLVLRIAGYRDESLDRSSDALCTALQLTNFWQDIGRDWRMGRLYVPREVHEACGVREGELVEGRLSAQWGRVIETCAAFTRRLYHEGRSVCDALRGRLRFELRLTWLGGMRILERTERAGPRVFHDRPTLAVGDVPRIMWRAIRWPTAADDRPREDHEAGCERLPQRSRR